MVGSIPRMKTYKVCGTFDIGMHEYNGGVVFMNLSDAQLLFQMNGYVSGIEITLKSLGDVTSIKSKIIQLLRENTFESKNLVIVDWKEANKTLVDVLQVEKTVMFLILSLIILIAAFNIISSLMLLVHDKMKEIAILRTIGMTKGSIMRIFIMSGSLVGVIGTLLGATLGILFSLNIEKIRGILEGISGVKLFDPIIYFLTTLPSDIQDEQVLLIVFISLGLSLVATIYPAWRVSKTSPAEVLKY
jgi:lipoprotein-releasing system permease protein